MREPQNWRLSHTAHRLICVRFDTLTLPRAVQGLLLSLIPYLHLPCRLLELRCVSKSRNLRALVAAYPPSAAKRVGDTAPSPFRKDFTNFETRKPGHFPVIPRYARSEIIYRLPVSRTKCTSARHATRAACAPHRANIRPTLGPPLASRDRTHLLRLLTPQQRRSSRPASDSAAGGRLRACVLLGLERQRRHRWLGHGRLRRRRYGPGRLLCRLRRRGAGRGGAAAERAGGGPRVRAGGGPREVLGHLRGKVACQ